MTRFSSGEGYKAFEDAIPTIRHLQDYFGIRTAVISNGDSRIRGVLNDLGFPDSLDPVILSEEEGIEKPSGEIFMKTLEVVNQGIDRNKGPILPNQCLHVGDELICDYTGAINAGLNALLIRRTGPKGDHEHKEADEKLEDVQVIHHLEVVFDCVKGNER